MYGFVTENASTSRNVHENEKRRPGSGAAINEGGRNVHEEGTGSERRVEIQWSSNFLY